MAIAGVEVYTATGDMRAGVSDYFCGIIGSIEIVLPSGWANRFISGTQSDPRLLQGEGFSYFIPGPPTLQSVGGAQSYCVITPRVTFANGVMTWQYVRDANANWAYSAFGDGPANGTLFFGVL